MSDRNTRYLLSLIIIIVIVLGVTIPLYMEINSLRDEISRLRNDISALSLSSKQLTSQFNSSLTQLNAAYKSLEDRYNKLFQQYSSLSESIKYPFTITDALGRTVTIVSRPVRVISTAPSVTEMLFAINAEKLIVGVDKYSDYPPTVKDLVKNSTIKLVGGFSTVDVEAIVALKPDIVFMTPGVQTPFVYRLAELGLTVVALKEDSISDVFDSIMLVGRILDKIDGALNVVASMKSKITYAFSKVENYIKSVNITRVKVYWEVWPEPIYTVGSQNFINDIITLAGGVNIFGDIKSGYPVVSSEEVINKTPDVIITTDHGGVYGSPQDVLNMIRNRTGWNVIPAIKSNRVYVLTGQFGSMFIRPGPRVADAILQLAVILYPEAFGMSKIMIPNIISTSFNVTTYISLLIVS
ncbi:MAG: helical backbone metal receptor [Thermoprotei archaeon]